MGTARKLIDADALMGMLECGDWVHITDYNIAIYAVKDAPTVDAVPVVRGEWVGSDSQCGIACSVCGVSVDDFCCSADYIDMNYQPNFCPNCGADMRKDGDHETD